MATARYRTKAVEPLRQPKGVNHFRLPVEPEGMDDADLKVWLKFCDDADAFIAKRDDSVDRLATLASEQFDDLTIGSIRGALADIYREAGLLDHDFRKLLHRRIELAKQFARPHAEAAREAGRTVIALTAKVESELHAAGITKAAYGANPAGWRQRVFGDDRLLVARNRERVLSNAAGVLARLGDTALLNEPTVELPQPAGIAGQVFALLAPPRLEERVQLVNRADAIRRGFKVPGLEMETV